MAVAVAVIVALPTGAPKFGIIELYCPALTSNNVEKMSVCVSI